MKEQLAGMCGDTEADEFLCEEYLFRMQNAIEASDYAETLKQAEELRGRDYTMYKEKIEKCYRV